MLGDRERMNDTLPSSLYVSCGLEFEPMKEEEIARHLRRSLGKRMGSRTRSGTVDSNPSRSADEEHEAPVRGAPTPRR